MYVPPVPGPGNPAGGFTVAGNQLTTIAYGYPLPKVPMTAAPAPLPLAAQNPNPPAFLAAGPFNALDKLAAPTGTCMDPHPFAVIRLERIRDNPSSLYVGGYVAAGTWNAGANKALQAPVSIVCGVDPATGKLPLIGGTPWVPTLYDFWPNTLFDTREGTLRDTAMNTANPAMPTLNGTMHYIELDGKNLSSWFGGKIGTSSPLARARRIPRSLRMTSSFMFRIAAAITPCRKPLLVVGRRFPTPIKRPANMAGMTLSTTRRLRRRPVARLCPGAGRGRGWNRRALYLRCQRELHPRCWEPFPLLLPRCCHSDRSASSRIWWAVHQVLPPTSAARLCLRTLRMASGR